MPSPFQQNLSIAPDSALASGNTNYVMIPNKQRGPYQEGKITVIIEEDIAGVDAKWNVAALDFQDNYFTQSGEWMQTILEPSLDGSIFRANEFQQWAVKAPYSAIEDYSYVANQIGNPWPQATLAKGTVLELFWNARVSDALTIEDWFCSIKNPNGIYDEWIIDPEQFGSWIAAGDLILNYDDQTGPLPQLMQRQRLVSQTVRPR